MKESKGTTKEKLLQSSDRKTKTKAVKGDFALAAEIHKQNHMVMLEQLEEIAELMHLIPDSEYKRMEDKAKTLGGWNFFSRDIVRRLTIAFLLDFNITEACAFAKISRNAYYDYSKEIQGFGEQMELARNWLANVAKSNVSMSLLSGDLETAKWWLQHRKGDEYKQRSETVNNHTITEAEQKELEEVLRQEGLLPDNT